MNQLWQIITGINKICLAQKFIKLISIRQGYLQFQIAIPIEHETSLIVTKNVSDSSDTAKAGLNDKFIYEACLTRFAIEYCEHTRLNDIIRAGSRIG